ncbi:hypothetical protein GUI12_01920 [Anaplasmataceae bacterium AB001_6]|nr:hypothetical protein GUI12_01920 [Anaplasmataceae bacterium AB001_6]
MITGGDDFISQLTSLANNSNSDCVNASFFIFYNNHFSDMNFNVDLICGADFDDGCGCSGGDKVEPSFLLTRSDYEAALNYGEDVSLGSMIGIKKQELEPVKGLSMEFINGSEGDLGSYYMNVTMPYKSGDIRVDPDQLAFFHSVIDNEDSPVSFYGYLQDNTEILLNALLEDSMSRIFLTTKDGSGQDIAYENDLNLVKISVKDVDFNTLNEFANGIKVSSENFKYDYNRFSIDGNLSRGTDPSVYKLNGLPRCFDNVYSSENVTTLMSVNIPAVPFLLKYHVVNA